MNRVIATIAILLSMAVGGCGNSATDGATDKTSADAAHDSAKDTHADHESEGAADKHAAGEGASSKAAEHDAKGGHAEDGEHAQAVQLTDAQMAAEGVKVAALAEAPLNQHIALTATIQANQDRLAHVAPRIAGRVARATANLGDRVKSGQVLAVLDSLEMGEAHSAYLKARTQAQLARSTFERAQSLNEQEIISQKEFLAARAEHETALSELKAAEDKLRLLGVRPGASTGAAISTFPLTSPFAGTVIEKDAVLGELYEPSKSMYTVADLSTVWILANVYEKDLARLRVGAPATVTVSAYPDITFKGTLTYIGGVLDKDTRTLQARIEVRNPDALLKPEMFATASVETTQAGRGLSVPSEAIVLIEGQPTLFIREGDGFHPRTVALGGRHADQTEIRGGVKPGEQVVVAGTYALKARVLKDQIGDAH